MGQFVVILAAAGRSTRFGDPKQKKIYAELEGRPVWLRALDPFLTHGEVEQIIVAIAPEDREMFDRRYRDQAAFLNLDIIDGGAERAETVARALHAEKHDAAGGADRTGAGFGGPPPQGAARRTPGAAQTGRAVRALLPDGRRRNPAGSPAERMIP